MKNKIVLIFLDGFGLAPLGPDNPYHLGALPYLESFLGCPLVAGVDVASEAVLLKGIDARLGVEGLPQSATGQTALFTGVNAAQLLGFHYPAFPNKRLVEIIRQENVYLKAQAASKSCLFANAYSLLYFQYVQEKRRRHSVTTHCLLAAGLPMLTLDDLEQDRAVFWDISRFALATYPLERRYRTVTGAEAGRHLAGLSRLHDLVTFECFLPDLIGHKKNAPGAREFFNLLDDFLMGIKENLSAEASIVLVSDHGNVEDLSTGLHTRNPVPLLVLGRAAPLFKSVESIVEICPAVLKALAAEAAF